ncbi:diuretic hormone receptor isoform X2 [Solenopsis invicta]|uniref:diuretic hormone receptor isoform X2 n=1 Tax=Solenopsis invicta TaxID=13686 RepID=UPI00193DF212|nr:diuretic hormone receptor isoform X2 [Solenopsis invicta]
MAWYPANGTKPQVGDNYVLNVLNYINELNESFSAEHLKCLEREHQDQENQKQEQQECEVNWDTVLCWPRTLSGTLATIPCFDELNGIPYDSTQNASRWCMPNGTWDSYSNYSMCLDVRLPTTEPGIEIMTTLYFIGYSISLFTLIMAVCIFIYYKELRCLRNNIHRNNIHTNLMFTYILADLTWILTTIMQVSMQTDIPTCVTLFSLLHYFHLTNFFWMFVEGLYLYLLVVKTFTGDNIKLRLCLVIGWGIPVLVIVMWGIAKSLNQKVTHHVMNQANQEVALWKHCPWMTPHPYDWFYQASALTVLAVNMIFLFMIMRVLITKLWSSNNVETQQYRKASKALLVLIPLLGVTYVLVIAGPTKGQVANAFYYARAVLLSSQGFFVALFYCFLNTEVQNTVRHHFARWSTARNLGTRRRLCQPSNPYRKRESTVSETTTTTVIGLNSTTTFLDKSKRVISEELNE